MQPHALTSHRDSVEVPKSQASEGVQIDCLAEHSFFGDSHSLDRSVIHKSRLFGQSHWITVAALVCPSTSSPTCYVPLTKHQFRDLVKMTASYPRLEYSKAVSGMQTCKAMAKSIKSQRAPAWPTLPTAVLPSRGLADELVDAYLRTTETVYRVLHIPSFRQEYEQLWLHGSDAPPSKAFLVQLKLILAIGATVYDEKFSLRVSAVTWIYEAQNYLSEPNYKSRLSLQSLQTDILLLIAREVANIDGDSIWISVGALIRTAMHIGLHKDPANLLSKPRSRLGNEMRRRLWNTILELALQSSLVSGKPPLVSLNDFDTRCPSNLNDDQLMTDLEDPTPWRDGEFTQMSIPIALRRTFPLRLAVAKILNDPGSQGTYEETLKLDAELRALYKDILWTLQPYKSGTGASTSRFDTCVLDVIMHRYLTSLHVPFLDRALKETAYAYSRKVVVDSALRVWYAANSSWPSRSRMTVQSPNPTAPSTEDDFSRFTICGSGFFRTAVFQATLIIAAELKAQLQEEASLGPVMLRPDLLAVLQDSKHFSLQCIKAGETNTKGYLFSCLVASQIDGLKRGLGQDELRELIVQAAGDAMEICLPLLEKMHEAGQEREDQITVTNKDGMFLGRSSEAIEDWDFLVSPAVVSLFSLYLQSY